MWIGARDLYEDRYAILPEMGKAPTTEYLLNRPAQSRMLASRDAEFGRVFGLLYQVAALADEALQRSGYRAGDHKDRRGNGGLDKGVSLRGLYGRDLGSALRARPVRGGAPRKRPRSLAAGAPARPPKSPRAAAFDERLRQDAVGTDQLIDVARPTGEDVVVRVLDPEQGGLHLSGQSRGRPACDHDGEKGLGALPNEDLAATEGEFFQPTILLRVERIPDETLDRGQHRGEDVPVHMGLQGPRVMADERPSLAYEEHLLDPAFRPRDEGDEHGNAEEQSQGERDPEIERRIARRNHDRRDGDRRTGSRCPRGVRIVEPRDVRQEYAGRGCPLHGDAKDEGVGPGR